MGSISSPPAVDAGLTLSADASNYTAQSPDFQNTLILAPSAAAACRDR